jgi:hypothetical protein
LSIIDAHSHQLDTHITFVLTHVIKSLLPTLEEKWQERSCDCQDTHTPSDTYGSVDLTVLIVVNDLIEYCGGAV